jgi:hypothetical protein
MLGVVGDWTDKFNNLPKVGDTSWATNMANAVDELTTGLLEISNIKTIPAVFTFGKAAFEAALLPLAPVPLALTGATNFATAWETGINASTMTVSPGASVDLPATPANTYSSVASTLIDVASVTSAKTNLIIAIAGIVPADNADAFATAFRNAFLELTCTTSGMNSVTPTPTALVNTSAPVA